jgi:hypothetical protein
LFVFFPSSSFFFFFFAFSFILFNFAYPFTILFAYEFSLRSYNVGNAFRTINFYTITYIRPGKP